MYRKTERLELKPIADIDRNNVIAILRDDIVKQTYMVPDFETEEAAEKLFFRLRDLSMLDSFYQVGIFFKNELIGIANEVERDKNKIEVGYAILPSYHNQGYGTEMLIAFIEKLFEDGFSEVIAGVFEENVASIRIMEKCGMKKIEKKEQVEYRGKTHQCVYYVKDRK